MLKTAGIILAVVILAVAGCSNSFTEKAAAFLYDAGVYEASFPLYEREADIGNGQAVYMTEYMY